MSNEPISINPFARRVRELLEARKFTIAELADRAELAPSLVSKLLTDTDAARREPRLEHILALARALEIPPRELVLGTTAQDELGEWFPRREFEEESRARSAAQSEAAKLRTELAGARSEAATLKANVDQLSREVAALTRRLGDVETSARREQMALRVARESTEAKLASAIVERDQALGVAGQNYEAWANARSQILQLQRAVAEAKASGWIATAIGTVGGAILGVAAAKPLIRVRRRRIKKRAKAATSRIHAHNRWHHVPPGT